MRTSGSDRATFPVFVGSTFLDLQLYRAAVRDALHGLENVVRGMEYFGSLPETPKEECLRIVRSCRAYVGVFGMRYGSVDAATGKSLTHLEYEEAQRIRLPSLIYLLDEDRQPVLPRHVDFGPNAVKLAELKADLKLRHVVSFFTTPEDLAGKVSRDLPALAERDGFEVRRGELSNVVEKLPRVDWLTEQRYGYLKEKIGVAAGPISSDAVLREVIEFLLAGDRLAASFLVARSSNLDFRGAIDLLMQIDEEIRKVVEEGYKRLSFESRL